MHKISKIGRGLFGITMLGALALGVTQAFATPALASAESSCRPFLCKSDCYGKGANDGQCIDGVCVCS